MTERPPTFFSVDVETTGTSPLTDHVLTVGVVCVSIPEWTTADGEHTVHWDKAFQAASYYQRIKRTDVLDRWWPTLTDPKSTLSWWLKQNDEAQREAFRDQTLQRVSPFVAMYELSEWLNEWEPDFSKRVFVANPVSFDWPFMDALLLEAIDDDENKGLIPPVLFPHRTLCLRSMGFGQAADKEWKAARDFHEPAVPHHALSDAKAQADDLIRLLELRQTLPKEERHT